MKVIEVEGTVFRKDKILYFYRSRIPHVSSRTEHILGLGIEGVERDVVVHFASKIERDREYDRIKEEMDC